MAERKLTAAEARAEVVKLRDEISQQARKIHLQQRELSRLKQGRSVKNAQLHGMIHGLKAAIEILATRSSKDSGYLDARRRASAISLGATEQQCQK